ncbi:hypothetical protein D3C75_959860 [compost metagenome]
MLVVRRFDDMYFLDAIQLLRPPTKFLDGIVNLIYRGGGFLLACHVRNILLNICTAEVFKGSAASVKPMAELLHGMVVGLNRCFALTS